MKFCEHCNKLYTDDKIYCPECGKVLTKPVEYDIFGDPMDDNKKDDVIINNENETTAFSFNIKEKSGEIFAFISLGAMFIPFIGLIFIINAIMINLRIYKSSKKNLGYLILSVVALVLSIIWIVLVIKYGILEDMFSEVEDIPSDNV